MGQTACASLDACVLSLFPYSGTRSIANREWLLDEAVNLSTRGENRASRSLSLDIDPGTAHRSVCLKH